MADLFILYICSLLTFIIFGWDKHLALFNKRRIPEFVLILLAFFAGAFGALCAMILFRHKISHKKFKILVPCFLFAQIMIVVLLRCLL